MTKKEKQDITWAHKKLQSATTLFVTLNEGSGWKPPIKIWCELDEAIGMLGGILGVNKKGRLK